jgi:RNA polymerase sigma-70 factor (ECF subfamily)
VPPKGFAASSNFRSSNGLEALRPHAKPSATDRRAERELIRAARKGDRRAAEKLLGNLIGTVYRFGRGFCRNPEEAEDLTQDVLHALLAALPRFRGESALSTWAFTVARRVCARRKRRMARQAPLPERADTWASAEAGPLERAERHDLADAIQHALALLPPAHREVVMMRDVEGLPASEVARVLGIGERAVKSRLHRARLSLRESLAPHAVKPRPAAEARRCPDTVRLLSRHLEGDLDGSICDRLAEHVAQCGRCASECESLREALGACRAWGNSRIPPAERERIRAQVRRAIRELETRDLDAGT